MAEHSELKNWLIAEWTGSLERSIESMAGEKPTVTRRESTAEVPSAVLGWEQSLDIAPGCHIWVGADETTWRQIADIALRAAGLDDASAEDLKGTWLELLGQATAATAQVLGSKLGREVVAARGSSAANARAGSLLVCLEIELPNTPRLQMHLALSPALEAKLDAAEQPETESSSIAAPAGSYTSKTLDLLLEVELPVAVSFGRSELPLKDVLKLTTGSIVELNRSVAEPVEIIVNNCVIARGEVVVLEGNYGVRITEVISRQERLRTLH
jgi:flagellar motor switch protein FliN